MTDPKAIVIEALKELKKTSNAQIERKLKLLDEEIETLETGGSPNQANFVRLFKILRELVIELQADIKIPQ